MQVKDLRKLLKKMPGEMGVYLTDGMGVRTANHVFKGNLIGVEQFCEIVGFFQDATPPFEDTLIERQTGFKNRKELIDAYTALRDRGPLPGGPPPSGDGTTPVAPVAESSNVT